jgi:hypothetical protein
MMITADSLLQSFKHELVYAGVRLLNTIMHWFVPMLFVAFVIVDGVVTRNELRWANEPRAWLMICLFGFGMITMALNNVKFDLVSAIIVGVIAAMIISQSSSSPSRPDITLWVIAAGAFLWQRAIQHDWRASFARAGMALALVVLIVYGVGSLSGIPALPTGGGAWNRNVIAGVLAALIPSVISRRNRGKWIVLAAMAAAIVVTGSRGGILAAMVALVVSIQRRPRFLRLAAIATPVAVIVLAWYSFTFRSITTYERVIMIREALQQWRQTSIAYGVGPGNLWFVIHGNGYQSIQIQAHNFIVNIAAMVGIVGAFIIGAALSNIKRLTLDNWQLATLSALVVHGMVDDPFTWLPTMLIAAIAAAGYSQ